MTTSDDSWSNSFRRIGDLERPDHFYLTAADECAYFGDYTARAGFGHSATNDLIANLKKSPSKRGRPEWAYKEQAIARAARVIRGSIRADALPRVTFVPIPPSKPAGHPEHDDRMLRVAQQVDGGSIARELLRTVGEREAAHLNSNRRDPDLLRQHVEAAIGGPRPDVAILLDDVLTTGCSFMICKEKLVEAFPGLRVIGLFIARRVPQIEFPPFEDM